MVPISHFFLAILAASSTLHFQATASLDWASSPPDGATVLACVGQEAILEWNFTLETGDQVQNIRWYVANDTSKEIVATFTDGNFITIPTFSERLRHLGNAVLVLDHVTLRDKASYSVDVDMHLASGMYASRQRSVRLEVAGEVAGEVDDEYYGEVAGKHDDEAAGEHDDEVVGEQDCEVAVHAAPPVTAGQLVVTQGRHAVYNNVTADWRVLLRCGTFTDLGQPPVDVLWKTPSGSFQPSSNYDNGYFELLLDNPVEGGNFSCRLNPSPPAAVCFHEDDPMMQEAKVTVDEMKARLTLIEAQQSQLKTENADLTDQLHSLKTQNHKDITNLTNVVHMLQDKVSARVSFHASLSSDKQVNGGTTVILDRVINNEGGSYSSTTGQFTVPKNGTYGFFASVETGALNPSSASVYIMMDDTAVSVTYSYNSGNIQGSSCHAVLHLVQGQRVWLKTYSISYYWDLATVFSGFLLSAD